MILKCSKILLLTAAFVGIIPANTCLLMLAGACRAECCGADLAECDHHAHHHDAEPDEADANDEHPHRAPISNSEQHHETCVVVSADIVVAQVQRAPVLDLRADLTVLPFAIVLELRSQSSCVLETPFGGSYPKPPPDPLYLRNHAFLI